MPTWTDMAPRPADLADFDDKRHHAFLSYRSVDRPWVLNLYDVLKNHGCKVFVDQIALKPGDRLIGALERGLRQSRAGILVWSATAADSDWVTREYETMEHRAAEDPDFTYVIVNLDGSELPEFAANRLHLDFASYPDGPNGGELLRLLYGLEARALSDEAARFASDQDEEARRCSAQVSAAIRNQRSDRLVELFEAGGLPWQTSSALGCKAGEGLVKLDQVDQAIELFTTLRQQFPRAIRPQQLMALALARRGEPGDLDEAQDILAVLYESGERDPETLGLYARTWMDRYSLSGKRSDLEQSRHYYAEGFTNFVDDYYTGINAAAKSVLLGELETGAEYAELVEAIVGDQPTPGDYWKTVTAAEVQLLQGHFADATELYRAAVTMARAETGSHRSTWAQITRLLDHLEPSDDERARLESVFAHLSER
jgi:hypothetical protein